MGEQQQPGIIDQNLDRILHAAGSSLRHYMPSSKEKLREAMQQIAAEDRATIEALVEALERAQVLARLVTVRQAINAGDDAIEASGLNPWAMNEGLADGTESVRTDFIDSALLLARGSAGK